MQVKKQQLELDIPPGHLNYIQCVCVCVCVCMCRYEGQFGPMHQKDQAGRHRMLEQVGKQDLKYSHICCLYPVRVLII